MRLRTVLGLCAALALTVGVATATAGGGNSTNAKKCQKGGWQTLVRSEDGSSFASEEACASYAAKGGALVLKSKHDCELVFGTFVAGTGPVLWTCVQWHFQSTTEGQNDANLLGADCAGDGGTPPVSLSNTSVIGGAVYLEATCSKTS